MKNMTISVKNDEDSEFIKNLLSRLDVSVQETETPLSKNGFASTEEFLSYAGSMKGQLISKEHLRSISWKKRNQ